jgi:hypothetical protein
MKYVILTFVILFCTVTAAQDAFPKLTPLDAPDGKISRENEYDGNSLWGYMDGAADTYLEYGFDKLVVQELIANGHRYRIEIFKMTSTEAAFGIYSVTHYKQTRLDTLGYYNCVTKYQAQFPSGKFYVSVVNDEGSDEEQDRTLAIALLLNKRISGEVNPVPQFFKDEEFADLTPHLKFVRGRLGVQNGLPQLENALSLMDSYPAYALVRRSQGNDELFTLITFPDSTQRKLFNKGIGITAGRDIQTKRKGKLLFAVKELSDSSVVYYESSGTKAENGELPAVLIK